MLKQKLLATSIQQASGHREMPLTSLYVLSEVHVHKSGLFFFSFYGQYSAMFPIANHIAFSQFLAGNSQSRRCEKIQLMCCQVKNFKGCQDKLLSK